MGRLALNPETRGYMEQPDFLGMLQSVGRNPQQMSMCAAPRHFPGVTGGRYTLAPGRYQADTRLRWLWAWASLSISTGPASTPLYLIWIMT